MVFVHRSSTVPHLFDKGYISKYGTKILVLTEDRKSDRNNFSVKGVSWQYDVFTRLFIAWLSSACLTE
ncbi:MAG: hypothetical protein QNJ18_23675 [Xenococcaceae cyanobacterium MO_167.B52]|nr:hypothetical protein [Xenococcaceae cyanobacterium MO_167.B52]